VIVRPLQREDAKVAFSCGERELDAYFAKRAWPHVRDGIATAFVLEDPASPRVIAGFYTLSSKSVDAAVLASQLPKSAPRFPLPVTYIGCFAVATPYQGRGLGQLLMGDALQRALVAAEQVGSVGVFLDSLNSRSTAFYRTLGFVELLPFVADHQPMFMAMEMLRQV
jgi:GNAT superfamily N-acetyltransferase